MTWEILLPLLGFLVAVFAAMTGVGGGVFFVPLLTLVFSFIPAEAVGTTLVANIFGGIGATIIFARQKHVFFRLGLLLALATAPGVILGAYLTSVLPGKVLGLIFGVFLVVLAVRMIASSDLIRKKRGLQANSQAIACEGACFGDRKRLAAAFGLSFFAGLASGLLSVSGGVVLVPILVWMTFLPIHAAIGTSMFLMLLTSLFGLGQHYALGNVEVTFALLLGVGAIVGAQVGAWLCKKIPATKMQVVFALALLIISVQMIIKFL